ncbi:hypothetical protein L218DRAFT_1003304 [Marasmius fiardii PR-910]|nr:hypothetical protein L218DRAFT_1003304 [Marasmius fiardii PR-910]
MSLKLNVPIYYTTCSSRTNVKLIHPNNTSPELCGRAGSVGKLYGDMAILLSLPQSSSRPGIRHIQEAFAATCDSCSPEEWEALPSETKALITEEYCGIFASCQCGESEQKPLPGHKLPALVIHLGSDEGVHASPSYQLEMESMESRKSRIQCSKTYDEWDDGWNADDSAAFPFKHWSWYIRNLKAYHEHGPFLIFLTGFYAVKLILLEQQLLKLKHPTCIDVEHILNQRKLIDTHLKVVLFHELIHAA